MKKNFVFTGVLVLIFVAWIIYMLPSSLSKNIGEGDPISIIHIQTPLINGELEISSNAYEFTPAADGYKEIIQLFAQYRYHRYSASLFPVSGISYKKRNLDYSYQIFIGYPDKPIDITMGGDGRIRMNGHLYKMDAWGNKNQTLFMEELRHILENNQSALQN